MCSLKNPENLFIQSLPLHTSCLFSIFLSEYIVAIQKPYGIWSLTFVVDELSGLFYVHQSFLL